MDNETVYLPGKIRDRIQDLMKSRKVTQAELAAKIGCSESALSRFISGKTDKLGDESIIRIARAFEVSTDFLLVEGESKRDRNQLSGRTSQNKVVVFDRGYHRVGDYVRVRITGCTPATLFGDVISGPCN